MSSAPAYFVSRARLAKAAVWLSLSGGLLACTPERSLNGGSHASGGGSGASDAGVMDASDDAGHKADAGSGDAGTDSDAGDAGNTDPEANRFLLAIPPDWFDDYLPVPPAFAPTLPLHGRETTREPPGMYDPTSDQFFSYAFLWWLDGNPALDADSLRSDIGTYYRGLCGAATVTLAETSLDAPAAVRVPSAAFSGTLETGSCFDRPTPPARLELTIYDCPNHPSVLVRISSFPASSPISLELAALRDGFDCY